MKEKPSVVKSLILGIIIVCLGIGGISLFFIKFIEFYLGLIIGSITAMLQTCHLEKSINEALDKTPNEAKRYMIKNYFIRYTVIIIIMLGGVYYDIRCLVGIILGLFSLKISVYLIPLLNKIARNNA
ncbi:MAG: ATP synthase subunit I [Eubacteriales bacterium]